MRHSPHGMAMWSTLVMTLVVSLASSAFGGIVYDGTPPPDPSNETHWITNPYNLSMDQKDDWYIADHPFFYNMEKVRAPNGTWVDNPNATFAPFTVEEWRKNTMERVPWWIRWYVTGETRAVRKEMLAQRKNIIDHVVSPMDWGRSIRAQSVRAQWHEQLRHFWGEALGRSLWKNLKSGIQTLLFGGMQSFIESELFAKQIKGWTMVDYVTYANLTAEEYEQVKANAAEHIRDKFTRPYQYKIPADLSESAQRTLPNVLMMVKYFQPYANYTARYYDADAKHAREELPPPTMPAAISYPWPWSNRIAQLRATLVEVLRVEAARNSMANAANGNGSIENQSTPASSGQPPFRRRLQVHTGGQSTLDEESEAGVDARGEDGSGSDEGDQLDDASKEASIQRLEQLAREFHFTTGMPRMETMAMKDRYTPTLFPPLETFFNISIDANGSASIGAGDDFGSTEPEAGVASPAANTSHGNVTRSIPDYSSREGVYVAAQHFYSFATVESHYLRAKDYYKPKTKAPQMPTDGTMLVDDLTPRNEKVALVDCSAKSPCVARSGVTVYTPKLASAVQDVYVNASLATPAAADAQKLKRQDWIMNIIQEAFDAEKRAMASGLQAPSTVWNSYHDRGTDIFADTVFGLVNATKAMVVDAGLQWEPRDIWEALQDNTSSPLLNGYSHFRMMALHTKNAMGTTKVPQLVPFSTEQLMRLVGFVVHILKELETAIDAYEHKRDTDRMHMAIANATKEAVYYDGRLFGVLGYGYFLPATNAANVAYRDHKIPVPFHLLMRVLTRFHESHLLLLDESVHLAACVAMLQFDVRFYRCTQIKQEERATPRPMQTEKGGLADPLSPSPPSSSVTNTSTRLNSTIRTTLPSAVPPRPAPHTAALDWS